MSRSGDEMMLELAGLLGTMQKTAAKKDDDEKDKKDEKDEKDKKDEKDEKDKKDEDDKKDEKDEKDKKDKKANVMMGVVSSLVKLAGELDEVGADEASELVDEALRTIVYNLEKKK